MKKRQRSIKSQRRKKFKNKSPTILKRSAGSSKLIFKTYINISTFVFAGFSIGQSSGREEDETPPVQPELRPAAERSTSPHHPEDGNGSWEPERKRVGHLHGWTGVGFK